jgi:CDGSH-type Zn-finger protein/uncharacterized Fe-S cluster protein YjdI
MAKPVHQYPGKQIDVSWDKTRCLHVAECILGLRSVFDTSKTPWVQPDSESANQVASVIHRCPTGALHYVRQDSGPFESPDPQNTVRVAAEGPIYLRGEVQLVTGGESVDETRAALCRCGHSTNKPYCDGSHTRTGFEDDGRGTQKAVAESLPQGKVVVTPRVNGSILFEGPIEVQSSDGRILFRGEKVSLCRCGHSQMKPFCDGSHKTSGFEAP